LEYFLSDKQKTIKSLARRIAEEKILPVRAELDEKEEFPWAVIKDLANADMFRIFVPNEYEGLGGGCLELCLVVASGSRLAAFALTEPTAGSDALAIKTTANKVEGGYVLDGTKQFITNGGDAEIYTVIALTDKTKGARGASAFIVEKDTPGFSFGKKEKKMGIRSSSTRELVFRNCLVPEENIIGKPGRAFFMIMKLLDQSRPGVGAQAVGLAQGALEAAVDYTEQREQFGQSLISLPVVQDILAEMALQVEAARALVYAAARTVDSGASALTEGSAMAKVFASDVAMKVTTDAVQVCGGAGYMRDYPLEKMMRDAKITQIYEGSNQVLRNTIASQLRKRKAKTE